MSQIRCPDPCAFERAQYMRAVTGLQYVMFGSPAEKFPAEQSTL